MINAREEEFNNCNRINDIVRNNFKRAGRYTLYDVGHFDLHFTLSFVLWVFYSTSLYVSWKIENNESIVKISVYGVSFGMLVSCIKMGIDAIIILIIGKTNNQILLTFAMELGINL